MTLGAPLSKENLVAGSLWKLKIHVNGFESQNSDVLSTQAISGRSFELLDHSIDFLGQKKKERIKVRLLEDNYVCWFDLNILLGKAFLRNSWEPNLLSQSQIRERIPMILSWIENVANKSNKYLWGGTIGPNFDCSGLVQSAFSLQGIWLPRDAYQQEQFCEKVDISFENYQELFPGDLLFFGSKKKCTHVGLHIEKGFYWHSSGITNGRNGIGIDGLKASEKGAVSSYYRSQFRSARRVICCYGGKKLLQ